MAIAVTMASTAATGAATHQNVVVDCATGIDSAKSVAPERCAGVGVGVS